MQSFLIPSLTFDDVEPGQPIRIANSKAELGTVAFVFDQVRRCFIAIEKAQKPGYEFSSLVALPGGMCRRTSDAGASDISIDAELRRNVTLRVQAETKMDLRTSDLRPLPIRDLPITSYTVKGEKKYVVIFPWMTSVESGQINVAAADHSVDVAKWQPMNIPWERVSPANRLVIAAACWSYLDEEQRGRAAQHIREAHDFCKLASHESGLVPGILETQFSKVGDTTL